MCEQCDNPYHDPTVAPINVEDELDELRGKLDNLNLLSESIPQMNPKDAKFADDLINGEYGYIERKMLSPKQWQWVNTLLKRVKGAEPIYGDFDAIHVMFTLTGDKLKFPKIRLMSDGGTFVQLNFKPDTKDVDIYIDGWQGHGYRKFAGWIKQNKIVPYMAERITDDIKNAIQDLANDPEKTMKAMAAKLGVCGFCGHRLSDSESKRRGYGATCAKNYNLPWGVIRIAP